MKTNWKPIETAPKDGTFVLLWEKHAGLFVGNFRPGWASWLSMPGAYCRQPTHWHPLPAAPEAKEQGV